MKSKVEAAMMHQRNLDKTTSQAMAVRYCRGGEGNRVLKWLREISIDANFDFRRWRKHQSSWRNLRLWTPIELRRSDNVRRLFFPDLTMMLGVSTSVCCYNSVYP